MNQFDKDMQALAEVSQAHIKRPAPADRCKAAGLTEIETETVALIAAGLTKKTASTAFFALAEGWDIDEAQTLHNEAKKALEAAIEANEATCAKCGGACEHFLFAQAKQASERALDRWLTSYQWRRAAKEAAHLWEQIEEPGALVCLLCAAEVKCGRPQAG